MKVVWSFSSVGTGSSGGTRERQGRFDNKKRERCRLLGRSFRPCEERIQE